MTSSATTRRSNYDRIGNRLTETRGAVTDVYSYPANSAAGHNPKLQSIALGAALGAGSSRSYGYDEIGNMVQTVDDNEQLDFIHDASRRLVEMMTRPEDRSVSLTYDGRSFLAEAGEDEAACFPKKTFALYDSTGLLHRREHHLLDEASTIFLDSDTALTFAGRPLAILSLTSSTSKLTYLTTDHLGMPAAATSESGTLVWEGGFEPFGAVWNAVDEAVFLRFPGQWSDGGWADTSMGLYYNLNRWYEPELGRYTRLEPVRWLQHTTHYLYTQNRPTVSIDITGLTPCSGMEKPSPGSCCPTGKPSVGPAIRNILNKRSLFCSNKDKPAIVIDDAAKRGWVEVPENGPAEAHYRTQNNPCLDWCICSHENYHIEQARIGALGLLGHNGAECDAYNHHLKCLLDLTRTGPLITGN